MIIEREKNNKQKRYEITFESYREYEKEIYLIGDFITYKNFTIYIEDSEGYNCIATDILGTIIVDRALGRPIGQVLENRNIPFMFID